MPSASALSSDPCRRTISYSFIVGPEPELWAWFFPDSSFIKLPPPRPRKPRLRRHVDPWQPMAGRLELVADVARQAAKAARSRDPGALDILFDRVRVALLDTIKLYNTSDGLIR